MKTYKAVPMVPLKVVREILGETLMDHGVLNPTLLDSLEHVLGKEAVDIPTEPCTPVFETMKKILTLFFAWSPINFKYDELTARVKEVVTREEFEQLVKELKK